MKTESVKTVTYALSLVPKSRDSKKESYSDAPGLVIKYVYENSAGYSQRAGSEKPCKESINHDALDIFGNSNCKVENGSSKGGDDERQPAPLDFGEWSP